uniref:Protein kinase domain-containing protein n=1 Tax=Eutreptiella gymnastica TaxID=73025 RepID=A0A7S4CZ04_9EUGL
MVGPQWELLQNELRIMQRASSKCGNVVRLLRSCIKDGSLCLVMKQYAMNLKELAALHPQCQVPHHRLLRIGVDVCKGMEDLHREGILVLELKPQNLLWDQHRAVIADFEISHKLDTTLGR